ncbi:MAG: hypothetical protein AAF934_02800 [Bacteroidota bacterium]
MKTTFKFLLCLILTGFFAIGCAVKIPLSTTYFQNNKKVGVIYNIDSISVYKQGAQGLLDMALTSGKRFREPLNIVDKTINPTEKIKNQYRNTFSQHNKSLIEIDYDYDVKKMTKFTKPSDSKKYHKYDLRALRSNGIDEVLIINVRYGLLVSYYGMIETGKAGDCRIESEIIDLTDNSIIYKNFSVYSERIKGKWKTPPDYENLKNSIELAINNTLEQEKAKFK